MQREWSNWSGSLRFTPRKIETPENEELLVDLVRQAAVENRSLHDEMDFVLRLSQQHTPAELPQHHKQEGDCFAGQSSRYSRSDKDHSSSIHGTKHARIF